MPLLLCPNCNQSMTAVNRQGVEFDMCPTCRGVWLDRGELDKIIDRASVVAPAPAAAPRVELPHDAPAPGRAPGAYPVGGYAQPGYSQSWGSNSPGSAPRHGGGYGQPGGSYRRPKNWLSELFD